MADNTFTYMYKLDRNGFGNYALEDRTPEASNVQASDDVDNSFLFFRDNPGLLGDRLIDQFTVSNAGSLSGRFTFVSTAYSADRDEDRDYGFIARDASGDYYFFTNTPVTRRGNLNLTETNGDQVICFMPGTAIATPTGTANIEDLTIGDLVLTSDGASKPVRWIGRQTVSTLFADETRLPVRIATGALGENVPCRDLLVSNDHALLVEGVLVQAGALINGVTITRERDVPGVFTYYHVELDDHSLILAENVPAETFVDNVERHAFDNWAEYQALYPQGRSVLEMDVPRVKAQRQLPSAVRRLIASRMPEGLGAFVA